MLTVFPKCFRSLLLAAATLTSALNMRGSEALECKEELSVPVDAAWNAWTTPEELRQWLAPHADIELKIGGYLRTNYNPAGSLEDLDSIENEILAFEPERMLAIRVRRAPQNFPFRSEVVKMWTVIYFAKIDENRCSLRVVSMGFEDNENSKKMREFFDRGNAYTLSVLKKWLENRPGK